jgi:hypothetical protein
MKNTFATFIYIVYILDFLSLLVLITLTRDVYKHYTTKQNQDANQENDSIIQKSSSDHLLWGLMRKEIALILSLITICATFSFMWPVFAYIFAGAIWIATSCIFLKVGLTISVKRKINFGMFVWRGYSTQIVGLPLLIFGISGVIGFVMYMSHWNSH